MKSKMYEKIHAFKSFEKVVFMLLLLPSPKVDLKTGCPLILYTRGRQPAALSALCSGSRDFKHCDLGQYKKVCCKFL